MTWSVTIPGQPVSWDHAYKTGKVPGRFVGRDGEKLMIHRPVKTDKAAQYQRDAQLIVQAAAPSGWNPPGQVRMIVDLYLVDDMDDDNALKLLRDAVQKATGVDDMKYLSCTRTKEVVDDPRTARIVLTFVDL